MRSGFLASISGAFLAILLTESNEPLTIESGENITLD